MANTTIIEKKTMQKNKRPASKKLAAAPDDHDDTLAQTLLDLAIEVEALERRPATTDALKQKKSDLHKRINKCLSHKNDAALLEALELAQEDESAAYQVLKDNIEEMAENLVFRRDDGQKIEVNAFVIPLFAHTDGGLHAGQCFQDEEAFDLLRKSIHDAKLESPDASVVLVSYAYHLDEIEAIGYSQLHDMVREAADSMTRKKIAATPAIERSMSGWPENSFAPQDRAVELRFLLGFALKHLDDPFYKVPEKEAAADRYFDVRASRFRQWAKQATPLVQRCLAPAGTAIDIDFLYQDLFFGGKARGSAEYAMLRMMSELQQHLQERGIAAASARAIIGPTDANGEMMLRVNLYGGPDGDLVASSSKPIAFHNDLQTEAEDVYDALQTFGVTSLSLAMKFDVDGQAVDARPFRS